MLAALLSFDLLERNLSVMRLQDTFALSDLHILEWIELELHYLESQFIAFITARQCLPLLPAICSTDLNAPDFFGTLQLSASDFLLTVSFQWDI